MATKAKTVQKERAKIFMEAFAPLCCLKDSLECSGQQVTAQEAARNQERLGFRSPTAFVKKVAEQTGEKATSMMLVEKHLEVVSMPAFSHEGVAVRHAMQCSS